MYCSNCAAEIPNDAVVCTACGRPVLPLSQPTPQSVKVQLPGWSRGTRYFLLFATGVFPPIGILAGLIGLFKKETRSTASGYLFFGIVAMATWFTLTPLGGILCGLFGATVGAVRLGVAYSKLDKLGAGLVAQGAGTQTQAGAGQPVVVSLTMEPAVTKACPQCAEKIALEAKVCRFCGHHFSEEDLVSAKQLVQQQALQAQNDAKQTRRQNWSVAFLIMGIMVTFLGGLFTIIFIFYAFSPEAAKSAQTAGGPLASFAPLICTVPILLIGLALFFLGVKRARARKALAAPGLEGNAPGVVTPGT